MKTRSLPIEVQTALAGAARTPGWNNRRGDVKRFTLGCCRLIVVPARRWAYRRWERQTTERQYLHGGNAA